jgi:hypothetical protein
MFKLFIKDVFMVCVAILQFLGGSSGEYGD